MIDEPEVSSALQRAGLWPPAAKVRSRLELALQHVEAASEVLEVSQAKWANEEQGADVLVVQTRTGLLLLGEGKRGRFKPTEPFVIRAPYDYYQDLAEEDELAGASVFFLAKGDHKPFLLSFANARERHRMFLSLFPAHRGDFSRWGIQLDPANYASDFDRFYEELVASGTSEALRVSEWAEERYGQHDITNALGFAIEWRRCELDDQERRVSSSRVMRIGHPEPWIDHHPNARRLFIRLGEQLYDSGLLGPPYDERTLSGEGDFLNKYDAGPMRVVALMTLAAHAHAARDPRAQEWIVAAESAIPSVPAAVFSPNLRELWSQVRQIPGGSQPPSRH